jgi:uncharacterized delta-60 repeat protein
VKHTNTPYGLHWCHKALAAALSLLAATPLLAQTGPQGELDPNFGMGGKLTTDFFQTSEEINAVDAMPDGRFVVAGVVTGPNLVGQGGSPNFAVARYFPDGRLDPTFGTGGLVQLDRSGNVDEAHSVKVLPDRSVLAAGIIAPGAYSDFALVKLRANGSLDTSFGADAPGGGRTGSVLLDVQGPGFHDEGRYLALQKDGKIIVAGNTLVVVGNFRYRRVTVARFTADGRLDNSFGGTGAGYIILNNFYTDAQTSDYVTSIATTQAGQLPADDSIILSGYTFARNNAFVTRLSRDGIVDAGFGSQGRVLFSSGSSGGVVTGASELRAARLDGNGRIVLAGTGNDRGLTFLRLNANGSPDTSFGSNGRTLVKLSTVSNYDEPRALALQGNGKIVASGYATTTPAGTPQPDFFVVRLNANGQPDQGFGDGSGRKAVAVSNTNEESRAVAVEPSGNLLVAGYALRAGTSQSDFAILRVYGERDQIFYDDLDPDLF